MAQDSLYMPRPFIKVFGTPPSEYDGGYLFDEGRRKPSRSRFRAKTFTSPLAESETEYARAQAVIQGKRNILSAL